MSLHVFGAVITSYGCAANNRGETEGNITTLQKLLWKGNVHTTVSAEAIRWALRYYWQNNAGLEVNREWNDAKDDHQWRDAAWRGWETDDGETFIDDDLLGFMKAEGAKVEAAEDSSEKAGGKKAKQPKGTVNKRRGVLEISRAVSTTPFVGDITFNAKSGTKDRTSLYGTETHSTRYQYGFAMTPEKLRIKARFVHALNAIASLGEVAGNHSRFLFDFAPESIILRITEDPAPRILYCFDDTENGIVIPDLIRKIKAGDIKQEELFIGGLVATDKELIALCPEQCHAGVMQAVSKAIDKIKSELRLG